MPQYSIEKNNRLEIIKENPFKLERELQNLTESNLFTVFGYEFVKSEFKINNFRIDTLAFDKNANSFVIIEYKRDKNFSVVDQGYAYLALMLNNKADFILEYNENCKNILKKADVDWSQSRVIFIAPSFTSYQKEAINFKDLPIELWEIKRYSNNTVNYHQIQSSGASESITTISNNDQQFEAVSKEIKVYTEDELLSKAGEEIKELYEKVKNAILNLADLEIRPKKLYIAFASGSNIVCCTIYTNVIKLWINLPKGELDDPKHIARDVSEIGHWGTGNYEILIENDENLEYILSLIKQAINNKMKND